MKKDYRTVRVAVAKNSRGYYELTESVIQTIENNIQPGERVVSVYVIDTFQDHHKWIYATRHEILFERDVFDYREKA